MSRKDRPFNNPFFEASKDLKRTLKKAHKQAKRDALPKPAPPPPPPEAPKDDDALFQHWMRDATPLANDPHGIARPEPPPGHARDIPIYDEDEEVVLELASLVDGTGVFDISDSDEFVEGAIEGFDRRIQRRLRRGDFAVQAHLDLHGMTRDPARAAVERFIVDARAQGFRVVLIVHGRGLNSKDQVPVLKSLLIAWLQRTGIRRNILAFCTARPHDGGAGAVYVLLRRHG